MADEENTGARSVGWTDCGTNSEGVQILVNLLTLRHIEIAQVVKAKIPSEVVRIFYHGVEDPIELSVPHSKVFLEKVGLRQAPEESSLWTPDKAPLLG